MAAPLSALRRRARFPIERPALGGQRFLDLRGRDKGVVRGALWIVLPERLGHAAVRGVVAESDVNATAPR